GSSSAPATTSRPGRSITSTPSSPSTSPSKPARSTITFRCCSAPSPTPPTAAAEPRPQPLSGEAGPLQDLHPQQTAEADRSHPAGLANRMVTVCAGSHADELEEENEQQGPPDIEPVRQGGEPTHAGLPRFRSPRDPRSQRHLAAVGRLRDRSH